MGTPSHSIFDLLVPGKSIRDGDTTVRGDRHGAGGGIVHPASDVNEAGFIVLPLIRRRTHSSFPSWSGSDFHRGVLPVFGIVLGDLFGGSFSQLPESLRMFWLDSCLFPFGLSGRIRTYDLEIRNLLLYPSELQTGVTLRPWLLAVSLGAASRALRPAAC